MKQMILQSAFVKTVMASFGVSLEQDFMTSIVAKTMQDLPMKADSRRNTEESGTMFAVRSDGWFFSFDSSLKIEGVLPAKHAVL